MLSEPWIGCFEVNSIKDNIDKACARVKRDIALEPQYMVRECVQCLEKVGLAHGLIGMQGNRNDSVWRRFDGVVGPRCVRHVLQAGRGQGPMSDGLYQGVRVQAAQDVLELDYLGIGNKVGFVDGHGVGPLHLRDAGRRKGRSFDKMHRVHHAGDGLDTKIVLQTGICQEGFQVGRLRNACGLDNDVIWLQVKGN